MAEITCEDCDRKVDETEATLLEVAKEDREELGDYVYLCNTCMKKSKHVSFMRSIFTSKDYTNYLSGKGK